MTWHQFRATTNEPLGFLCMVNATRDKPQLPSPEDLAKLREAAGNRGVPGQPADGNLIAAYSTASLSRRKLSSCAA